MARPATTNSMSHMSRLKREQRADAVKALKKYPKLTATAPSWLDDTAQKEWHRVVPLLLKNTPVSELDVSLIASHCMFYSTVVKTTKIINEDGEIEETDRGEKQTAASRIREKAAKELKSIDSSLGLTPQSRIRMELHKAMDDQPKDKFQAILS